MTTPNIEWILGLYSKIMNPFINKTVLLVVVQTYILMEMNVVIPNATITEQKANPIVISINAPKVVAITLQVYYQTIAMNITVLTAPVVHQDITQ